MKQETTITIDRERLVEFIAAMEQAMDQPQVFFSGNMLEMLQEAYEAKDLAIHRAWNIIGPEIRPVRFGE